MWLRVHQRERERERSLRIHIESGAHWDITSLHQGFRWFFFTAGSRLTFSFPFNTKQTLRWSYLQILLNWLASPLNGLNSLGTSNEMWSTKLSPTSRSTFDRWDQVADTRYPPKMWRRWNQLNVSPWCYSRFSYVNLCK